MAIQLKSNCNIVNTQAILAQVLTGLNDGTYDFDQAQAIISSLYEKWKQTDSTSISFQEQLIRAGLDSYGFEFNTSGQQALPQLAIQSLDISNPELFRYRDTARNKINGTFSHQVFDFLFINRKRTNKYNPYITTKSDFNFGVTNLKNYLVSIIINELGIEHLKGKKFFDSTGAIVENGVVLYQELMQQSREVGNFLKYYAYKTLDDPIKNEQNLKVLQALIALNNFDSMLATELNGLITINPSQVGMLNNINYSQETEGTSTEYWAADTHEDKNIKNFTSNMAKFIMRQIPKVVKTGNNYVQINGQYLTPNDLYILSSILKQAEFEYNILHAKDGKQIILATNLVDGIYTLFRPENRYALPALRNAKVELLDSIESFLWEGDTENFSISDLYKENFTKNRNILDVESLLDFEVYQSSSPAYIEISESGLSDTKNYGGVYAGGNALLNNITDFVVAQLQSKKKRLSKEYYNDGKPVQQDISSPIINVLLTQVLGFESPELYANFIVTHINTLNILAKEIAFILHDKTSNSTASIREALAQPDQKINLYKAVSRKVDSLLSSKIPEAFKVDYAKSLSDRAITQFDSNSGATIPTYRLNSAITHLQWFMHQYKTQKANEEIRLAEEILKRKLLDSEKKRITTGGFETFMTSLGVNQEVWKDLKKERDVLTAPYTNILADNPLLLSKYTDDSLNEFNTYYKGYAAYFLGIGDSEQYTSFNELPPSDQMSLLILHNLQTLKNGIFYFQPVCYSDKVSIGLIGLNTHTLFEDGSTLEQLLYSDDAIEHIRKIDFKQRQKNLCVTINNILYKWHKYATYIGHPDAAKFKPITEDELFGNKGNERYSNSRREQTSGVLKAFAARYQALNEFLASMPEKGFRRALDYASKNGIEFIDELDYVLTFNKKENKYQVAINKSIALDFSEVQSWGAFNKSQEKQMEKAVKSPEFLKMIKSLQVRLTQAKEGEAIYDLLVSDKQTTRFFKKEYSKEVKGYIIIPEVNSEGTSLFELAYRKQAALANMGRFAFIDLVSKSYYLDPSKNSSLTPEKDRAKRIDAMAKRMVLYPATIQAYQQGRINGVSQEARVSVIEDPKELTWNLNGDTHKQDIYDGSGFISPFWSRMEDNSLPGHGIKGTKKTLGTSTRGLNSTLFKWAEFPITNEGMRMSHTSKYDLHTIFKKMHDETWSEDIDITRSFTGAIIDNPSQLIQKRIYVSDGFVNWMIAGIKKIGYNQYEIIKYEVNAKGEILDTTGKVLKKGSSTTNEVPVPSKSTQLVKIDSIYALWQTLGGIHSMELVDGYLEPSESSIDATFEYIINVGNKKIEGTPRHWSQSTISQPLRNKFIAICANKSAIKRGAANINTAKDAWSSDKSLNFFTINTSCFGVQLDANHHSDMSDVREMSQTISTLAGNGYTMEVAEQAYNSIGDLVQISLKKVNKYISTVEKQGIDESIRMISEKLVQRLATEDKISSTDAFVDMFSEELSVTLPISDRRFYKLFVKEILEDLNKSSIRRRYSGLGGILNPASNIVQLYTLNGQTYTYPTLLRKAKRELRKNPEVIRALSRFTTSTSRNKDLDIVKFYMLQQTHPDWKIEDIILSLDNDVTQKVKPHSSNIIKVLDTIRYRIKNELGQWSNWTVKQLDSEEALLEYKALLDANTDYVSGESNMEVELILSKPHDLRPQSISWTTEHTTAEGQIEKIPQSVYTTIGARLSTAVGKTDPGTEDMLTVQLAITELTQLGQEFKQQCEL